ncbi:MAG TPA: NTP transferase domain-containing protein [Candidatus Poseidoniaceae archaeon]|nr:NTP transferase domain-containing protein [Candidatus Poseidoniaceae archaeon]|tara:strand:+ start:3238 stop:3822 length:585 start_codon:yes stop_codon:yes gene_type:complete
MGGVEVILLAAGRSSRLGQPKALVDVHGQPLIQRLMSRLHQLNDVEVTIVTNTDLLADLMLLCPSAHVVLNPDPEKGRTGSVQRGLSSILERNGRLPRKVLLVPVDRPGWSVEIVRNLLQMETSSCPVWDKRGGHPLFIVGDDINAVYLAKGDVPLSSLVDRKSMPVDFRWLHLNIDTKEDLTELLTASKEDWF